MVTGPTFSAQEYEEFQRFLKDSCGITLGENKQYLVASRLGRLMHDSGISSLGELIAQLRQDPNNRLRNRIIDAMTTNETYWFRDGYPFEILKTHILPEACDRKLARLRIWSTACSSGQEPYSISMTVQEYMENNPGKLTDNVEIMATDISSPMLGSAKAGLYDDIALARGLTGARRQKYFNEMKGLWKIKETLSKRVKFMELNLVSKYDLLGKFDVIYCRNVLIYFSNEMKREILAKMARVLTPRGYMIMGVSESPVNYSDAFEVVRFNEGVVYRLIGGG